MEEQIPVKLVFGRSPRDVVTIANSFPEQSTTPATARDLADQTLRTLAMQSYLEARQRADLRRYIAAHLFPSKGPCAPRGRVYNWQVGKSKIKQGTTSVRWYKARVLSQEGAICVIDTGTTVLRVNQSKLRQEKATWHNVSSSPDHRQPHPPSASAPRERLDPPRERARTRGTWGLVDCTSWCST